MTGHRIITLAALALLAAACNREVISPDEGRGVINFSAGFAQDATKASGEKASLANNDKIGVFACYTGDIPYNLTSVSPDFMYNQEVTYNESNWTYSPVKYWPNNDSERISFFSYYPYISSEAALTAMDGIIGFSNANAKGDPWLVFKLPENAPYTQTDLLYGTPCMNVRKQDGEVHFAMNHALACIADEVTVQMNDALYQKMHDTLDITIKGLEIVYSNLTTKARLVLNSSGGPTKPVQPIWKEVISGELLTSRTYTSALIEDRMFPMGATSNPAPMTIDSGHGLFYIPLQIAGQPKLQAEITITYAVKGVDDNVGFTDTAVKVIEFVAPGDASKKQNLALTLTENFNLEADIVTEEANGISMPGDSEATKEDVSIDYEFEKIFNYNGEVQTFTVIRTGTYMLEAWGAEGGSGNTEGAYGGYAKAQFNLSSGDVLYFYVGGKGGDGGPSTSTIGGAGGYGGWNGGRAGGASHTSSDGWKGGGGGGGATHIAVYPIGDIGISSLTQLSSYVGSEGHLLLVAGGGGGGSWATNSAGAGGGTSGIAGKNGDNSELSPWYIAGEYSYGALGGVGESGSGGAEGNGGGGGGYVGGNAKTTNNEGDHSATGGSGGSSAANNTRYNYVTDSFSTTAGVRSGDGQAKITFVAKTSL